MPTHKDKFFGSCSNVMFGDLGQLPPVGDCRMFVQNSANERTLHGFTAYRQFNKIYYLHQSVQMIMPLEIYYCSCVMAKLLLTTMKCYHNGFKEWSHKVLVHSIMPFAFFQLMKRLMNITATS